MAPADTTERVLGIVRNATPGRDDIYDYQGNVIQHTTANDNTTFGLTLDSHKNTEEYADDTIIEVVGYNRSDFTAPQIAQIRSYLATV